jgi:hypothetical protein
VNLPAGLARSQYKAAMAARVFRMVLNDLSPQDNATDLLHTNHSIWAGHLSDRVRKEEQFLPSGSVDQERDFAHKAGACMVADIHSIRTRRTQFDCT